MSTAAHAGELPATAEAHTPPEGRGLARDAVRLLVAPLPDGALRHARVADLPAVLAPGDLLVVNTSATLPAAIPASLESSGAALLHVSGPAPVQPGGRAATSVWPPAGAGPTGAPASVGPLAGAEPDGVASTRWIVEPRAADGGRLREVRAGEPVALPAGGRAELLAPYLGRRLWVARLTLPEPLHAYLACHGRPIRYRHVDGEWPLDAYQTAYAAEPGSAEMPSAGRPFTAELVTRLVARGIDVAPLVLHTGVSSPEAGERPFPERFHVPVWTAERANLARRLGGRVVAVGTTTVRALESAAAPDGGVRAAGGWTELVLGPDRPVRAVDGVLTGFHDPAASHLSLLEALAGRAPLTRAYSEGARAGYLRHEFGDLMLLLSETRG